MSNNLIELDFSSCGDPKKDVIKTICTTRINHDDETSPLKYGKLRKLKFQEADVDDDDIKLIADNLTELTHLTVESLDDRRDLITDKTITALLATERVEPDHPYTTLPNLTHLNLYCSGITCEGLIALSQSQLFSQLEYLDVGDCAAEPWDGNDQQLPPGLLALLTNSRLSKLKLLLLDRLIPLDIDLEEFQDDYPEIAKYFQPLGNYCDLSYA